jgi:hypothetical protein
MSEVSYESSKGSKLRYKGKDQAAKDAVLKKAGVKPDRREPTPPPKRTEKKVNSSIDDLMFRMKGPG